MKKLNTNNWWRLGLYVLTAISMTACNVSETETTEQGVKPWDSKVLYTAGNFVAQGKNVYKATTVVKLVSPEDSTSSPGNPLGAWARSSHGEYKLAQENSSSSVPSVSLSDIVTWDAVTIFHGNNLVQRDGNYYKSMWWNQNNDPNIDEYKNNFESANGTLNWGPWVTLTPQQALDILKEQQGAVNPPVVDPNPPVVDPNPPVITPPTGEVNPEDLAKFEWSKTAIYLEGDLSIIKGSPDRFFLSKWWNQDHSPITPFVEAWDSPWKEISDKEFQEILTNGSGGATPPAVKPDPIPTVPAPGYEVVQELGYIQEWSWDKLPQDLKDAFNENALKSSDIFASNGDSAVRTFKAKINSAQWDLLFPRRIGSVEWQNTTGKTSPDYYSHANFVDALQIIGNYAYLIKVALDPNTSKETSFERNYVLHKPTRTVRLVSQSLEYFATSGNDWLLNRPHKLKAIDYAAFGSEGSDNDKVRGIAGFLAHASHETSGSWAGAPGMQFDKNQFPGAQFPEYITTELPGELAWSLYYNEEVAYAGATASHYQDNNHKVFPPVAGQSYHGRGAFQLSWNYNYGLASSIFFGTSKVLLENANFIMTGGVVPTGWIKGQRISGGTTAFMTSLMFWLTPQGSKPSQQDTMILNRADGKYVRGTSKLNEDPGLGEPGYGWTINIMNGKFEAGKSWIEGNAKYDPKVARRVKHYKFFTQGLGGNNEGEVLDTLKSNPY